MLVIAAVFSCMSDNTLPLHRMLLIINKRLTSFVHGLGNMNNGDDETVWLDVQPTSKKGKVIMSSSKKQPMVLQ